MYFQRIFVRYSPRGRSSQTGSLSDTLLGPRNISQLRRSVWFISWYVVRPKRLLSWWHVRIKLIRCWDLKLELYIIVLCYISGAVRFSGTIKCKSYNTNIGKGKRSSVNSLPFFLITFHIIWQEFSSTYIPLCVCSIRIVSILQTALFSHSFGYTLQHVFMLQRFSISSVSMVQYQLLGFN